jgi:hypothetical protein
VRLVALASNYFRFRKRLPLHCLASRLRLTLRCSVVRINVAYSRYDSALISSLSMICRDLALRLPRLPTLRQECSGDWGAVVVSITRRNTKSTESDQSHQEVTIVVPSMLSLVDASPEREHSEELLRLSPARWVGKVPTLPDHLDVVGKVRTTVATAPPKTRHSRSGVHGAVSKYTRECPNVDLHL